MKPYRGDLGHVAAGQSSLPPIMASAVRDGGRRACCCSRSTEAPTGTESRGGGFDRPCLPATRRAQYLLAGSG